MPKSVAPTVGLDVGSSMIKVVELSSGRDGVKLRALGMAPTPEGVMENNIILDPHLLGGVIKKLLKDSGITSKTVISSVSGETALVVRVIEVPKMTEEELKETMRWEVERHVPFAANDVVMDFQPIPRMDADPNDQNMEVLLVVAQQDMVDKHVETVFATGLKPKAIDVEPLSISRALMELGPDPWGKKTVAIVNVGSNNTEIAIYKNGVIAFPRTIPLAGKNITRSIMSQLGVDEHKAEDLKKQHGEIDLEKLAQPVLPQGEDFLDFASQQPEEEEGAMPFIFSVPEEEPEKPSPLLQQADEGPIELETPNGTEGPNAALPVPVPVGDPEENAVQQALASVIVELKDEIKRSLDYFRGRPTGGEIDEILLCGGSSKLKNLDKYFEREFNIPTHIASPLAYVRPTAKNFSMEYLEDVAPQFAVAIGLAARDMIIPPSMPSPLVSGKRGKKK